MINNNKIWTLRFRAVDKEIFNQIKKGLKTIETRANTVKYRNMKVGDTLLLVCGESKLKKKISDIEMYKSIDVMVRKLDFKKIMPSVSNIKEMKDVYYSFPGYKEKLEECGILALHIV